MFPDLSSPTSNLGRSVNPKGGRAHSRLLPCPAFSPPGLVDAINHMTRPSLCFVISAAPRGQKSRRLVNARHWAVWVFPGAWVEKLLLFAYILIFTKSNSLRQDEAGRFRENSANPVPLGFLAEVTTLEVLNMTHTHTSNLVQ